MIQNNNWEKRNITDKHRVNEITEMYESLGLEVKVEKFNPDEYKAECNECMKESPEMFNVIFTRPGCNSHKGLFDE